MKNKKGFTIIELLAVVVVLALLSTFVGMSISRYRIDAKNKERNILRASLIENAKIKGVIDEFNNYRIANSDKYLNNTIKYSYNNDSDKVYLAKKISFNKNTCNNIENSYITYFNKKDRLSSIDKISDDSITEEMKTKLKEKLESSNEEVYCVYFYCEGELVIDDSDNVYGNKVVETVLINDNYKDIEVNYCR